MVVLFKDKKKKKILKKFITYKRAKQFYKTLMDKSKEIIFDVKVQSGKECKFELGLVELSSKQLIPVYMTDEFGRNIKVKLDEDGMTLFEISPYKKEELIFDIKENRKITVDKFIKSYLKGDGMKMISSLNNIFTFVVLSLNTIKCRFELNKFLTKLNPILKLCYIL